MRTNTSRLAFSLGPLVAFLVASAPPGQAEEILCGYTCQGRITEGTCVPSTPSAGCSQFEPTGCAHYGNCWAAKSEQAGFWGPVADDAQQAFSSSGEPESTLALEYPSPARRALGKAAGFDFEP